MNPLVPHLTGDGWKKGGNADLYRALLGSYEEALRAADPMALVRSSLRLQGSEVRVGKIRVRLSDYKRVIIIGGGKASGAMAVETEVVLGRWITAGVVNVPAGFRGKTKVIELHNASHPVPDQSGVEGVAKMLSIAEGAAEDDLFVCLFSGGGSSILPSPAPGLSLAEVQETTRLLLRSGATIDEMNSVRKHLSSITGGRLAAKLYPATILALIVSDVIGDRLDSIASGPTAPDPTTYRQAKEVLRGYRIWDEVPETIRKLIAAGTTGALEETPKPGSKWFRRVHNVIIGKNTVARGAAAGHLRKSGFRVVEVKDPVVGTARVAGEWFAALLSRQRANAKPIALVAGGETTVEVRGSGKGGRNQEFVLSAARHLGGQSRACIGAFATDGVDGPTGAAGAVADETTVGRARALGLEPEESLRNNDSNAFFETLGDAVIVGPTGTNVNDIFVGLRAPVKSSITPGRVESRR